MAAEEDRRDLRECVKLTRELVATEAFSRLRGAEVEPGDHVRTDADIDAYVRRGAESAYHPACTCRMGQDEMAVVDPETRVRGVEGLCVADASIMPSITSGNLNAPVMMIAERAADIILGRPPLEPSNAPVYVAPNYATAQR